MSIPLMPGFAISLSARTVFVGAGIVIRVSTTSVSVLSALPFISLIVAAGLKLEKLSMLWPAPRVTASTLGSINAAEPEPKFAAAPPLPPFPAESSSVASVAIVSVVKVLAFMGSVNTNTSWSPASQSAGSAPSVFIPATFERLGFEKSIAPGLFTLPPDAVRTDHVSTLSPSPNFASAGSSHAVPLTPVAQSIVIVNSVFPTFHAPVVFCPHVFISYV